ncbi:leucine-rich repeat domain-containing protein [Stieleria sp. JC731]|uniref:leucine-rich repeat domain-containing protein n=1 Tax=Pirellulaceae TaxID=2691357 RepID=UPI001E521377|nr:leucine-rich repeat domain-containing protein [Stieleria sp. JC731]MCC9599219.1 leucine-rich repeat domain-containing protein [Stieleria sp. JC731]
MQPIASKPFGFFLSTLVLTTSLVATAAKADDAAEKKEGEAKAEKVVSIFPDKALEEAVRKQVFAKKYNDEPIVAADVEKISRVEGVGQQIKNLEGLQHCHALMLIDLRDNQISDLTPIAGLKRLQSVSLSGNRIKSLEAVKDLTAMQLLDVSRNLIDDLKPLGAMSNLRTLYVAENDIKSLEPIASLSKIWSLDASGNELQSVEPVGGLKWITMLDLRNNAIVDVKPIAQLPAINILRLDNNKITDLSPLVEACKKDAEGDNRFAPFLRLYLDGNPIDEKAKAEALEALKQAGVKIK